MTSDDLNAIVNSVCQRMKGGENSRTAARTVAAGLTTDEAREIAAEYVVAIIARRERQEVLRLERANVRPIKPAESHKVPRKGTAERERWERDTERGREWAEMESAAYERRHARLNEVIAESVDRIRESFRTEWTAELMGQEFGLPSGERVAWGDATIGQHRERMEMFHGQAAAGIEGVARHQQAIDDLTSARVDTLSALTHSPLDAMREAS